LALSSRGQKFPRGDSNDRRGEAGGNGGGKSHLLGEKNPRVRRPKRLGGGKNNLFKSIMGKHCQGGGFFGEKTGGLGKGSSLEKNLLSKKSAF